MGDQSYSPGGPGGGGGGGYYGGGGGGGGGAGNTDAGGGGGGGSSYCGAACSGTTYTTGSQLGDGFMQLTPLPPPSVTITGPATGPWYNNNFDLQYDTFNATNCIISTNDGGAGWVEQANGASFCGSGKTITIEVGNWCQATGLAQCKVRVVGEIGALNAEMTSSFNIDLTPPSPQITAPPDTFQYPSDFTITYDCTDGDSGIESCWLETKDESGAWTYRDDITAGTGQTTTIDVDGDWCPNFQCIVRVAGQDNALSPGNIGVSGEKVYNAEPMILITDSETWRNEDFIVQYDAINLSTCELETRDGTDGSWVKQVSVPCGLGQLVTIEVPAWCSTNGTDECGVKIKGISPVTAENDISFNIDLIPPSPQITAPPETFQYSGDFTITYDCTDGDSGIESCWLETKDELGAWQDREDVTAGTGKTTTIDVDGDWCPNFQCIVRIAGQDNALLIGNIGFSGEQVYNAQPTITIIDEDTWWNEDFTVGYSTINLSTCELETRNGTDGSWANHGSVPCGEDQSVTIEVPDWCSTDGIDECGVKIKGTSPTTPDAKNDFRVDLTAPTISAFTVDGQGLSASPVRTDAIVDLDWTHADNASGSGVERSEVWRALDNGGIPGTWEQIDTYVDPVYKDEPGEATWWYGIHVVDKGNIDVNRGNCIEASGKHCGGVDSDGSDTRTELVLH